MAEITCYCFRVEKRRIAEAIENGCRTVDDIRGRLGATGGCGGCIPDVESLLKFYSKFSGRENPE